MGGGVRVRVSIMVKVRVGVRVTVRNHTRVRIGTFWTVASMCT